MPSIGDKATASAEKRVQDRLVKIYSKARKDMMEQMKEFNARFAQKDQEKRAKVKAGQMTQEDYDKWKRMQVLQSDVWRQKVEQATKTLEDANRQALRVINGEKMDVFAENANYEAYRISKDTGIGYGFSVYDKDTVGKLIREQPELMPRKVVNGKKDRAWNRTKISNAVTQSIIQGDSLPEMTERIARETAHENDAAMARYAATAMTSAQNAGRMETMERAKGMGIKVRKKWIATLDARTRDSHAELDGQVVDIDEPFITHNRDGSLAEIMFPGDPQADGEQVWNCRCTLGYVYEEYPDEEDAERISAEYYRDEDDNLRSRPAYVKSMSYSEWKKTMQMPQKQKAQKTTAEESELQRKTRAAIEDRPAAESIQDSLADAYAYHMQKHGLRKVSAEDVIKNAQAGFGTGFQPEISKLDENGQKNVAKAMQGLCRDYDTPLGNIRTMSPQEALGNQAFAFVIHNYETDHCEMVINPVKCRHTEKMVDRLKQLRDKGYIPKGITDEQLPEYIATHEFGHTLLNMQEKLQNSRNFVGADYDALRAARREIEAIYGEYVSEVGRIERELKASELDFIMNPTEEAQNKTKKLISEMDGVRISLYSMTNIDEFLAESFAGSRFGATSSPFAKRCMSVLDKYFRR